MGASRDLETDASVEFRSRTCIVRWLMTATLVLCAAPLGAQQEGPVHGLATIPEDRELDPGGFSLRLDAEELSEPGRVDQPGFSLGITVQQTTPEGVNGLEPKGGLELSLYAGVGSERASPPGTGLEFHDELEARRWPGGKTRPEAHLAAEQARVLEGGQVGAYGGDVGVLKTFDLVAMARLAALWWKTYQRGRLPPGASIPTDASLTLKVRDTEGRVPGHISVLPQTQGWIGDAVHARCDDRGRCVAEGLPSASSTLLVRGEGGSVVRWDHSDTEISIALRPTGWLQILPARCCPEIRVVAQESGAVVPVIQWINPGREDWVRVPSSGLTLSLPEGRYTIQINHESDSSLVDATVTADHVSTVEVE